jgi:hypothetical protein
MSPTITPPGCNTLAANGPRTAPDQSLVPGVTERFEEQQHSAAFITIETLCRRAVAAVNRNYPVPAESPT